MAGDLGRQPGTRTYDLDDLVGMVESGHIRIPHFQRDYRWDLRDVLRLLDSITKGYPIGSLLLWQRKAPAGHFTLGALAIDAPAVDQALWVVDGQQRITSLVNALSDAGYADDRFAVSFDLRVGEFVSRRNADPVEYIALPDLFDLPRLLAWFQARPHLVGHLPKVNEVASSLRKYELPAYVVQGAEPKILQDIFDRMNNYGKRLSRAEIFSALNAPNEDGVGSLTLSEIADGVEADLYFGRIDDDTVLHAMLATRGSDVTRDIRHELGDAERASAYEIANDSLRRAVLFLQMDIGVPHITFLPYRYLLVVLVRFLARHPEPAARNRQLLRRWYWRAALVGPDKGSATGTMRALANRIVDDENISVQGLLAYVTGRNHELPQLEVFNSKTAGTRIVLGALWALGPRSLVSGKFLSEADLARSLTGRSTANDLLREVVRRRDLPVEFRRVVANRVLFDELSEDGRSVREVVEDRGDSREDQALLSSNCLDPKCVTLLRSGEEEGFLSWRKELLELQVKEFLSAATGESFEDTPPLESLVLDDDLTPEFEESDADS